MRTGWKFGMAGVLGHGLVGGLFATTRVRKEGHERVAELREAGKPILFVLWHGHLLPLVYHHQQEGVCVLVSEHADGEYIARVLHRYGFTTARGSSTRGGSKGLRGLVRAVREGRDIAITPDGPRGPARVVKPGALVAAQLTGAVILPVGMGSEGAWAFDSWDRFQVPKPLSRLGIAYGEPMTIPREATAEELEGWADRVGAELDRLTEVAETLARGEGATER